MEYTQMKFDANAMEQAISKFRALLPNNVEDLRNFGEDKMKLALQSMLQDLDVLRVKSLIVRSRCSYAPVSA